MLIKFFFAIKSPSIAPDIIAPDNNIIDAPNTILLPVSQSLSHPVPVWTNIYGTMKLLCKNYDTKQEKHQKKQNQNKQKLKQQKKQLYLIKLILELQVCMSVFIYTYVCIYMFMSFKLIFETQKQLYTNEYKIIQKCVWTRMREARSFLSTFLYTVVFQKERAKREALRWFFLKDNSYYIWFIQIIGVQYINNLKQHKHKLKQKEEKKKSKSKRYSFCSFCSFLFD